MSARIACKSLAPALVSSAAGDPQLEELEELEAEAAARGNDASATAEGEDDPASAAAAKEKAIRKRCRVLPLELQRLFTRLQLLDRRSIGTNELTERGFKWTGSQGSVQHDVAELNRKLYERIEKSLARLPGDRLVGDLYKGVTGNAMTCMRCSAPRQSMQDAYDVIVTVSGAAEPAHGAAREWAERAGRVRAGRALRGAGCSAAFRAPRLPCVPPVLAVSTLLPSCFPLSPLRRARRSRASRTWWAP